MDKRKIGENCDEFPPENVEKMKDEKEILKLSKEIDERLEQKAVACNLSVVNVKSILTHLIKNDQVLTMLRNSMKVEKDSNLHYGLKLTRRKTKELVEKGQEIHWPLSPVKFDLASTSKAFLDVDYDTEEDEEYDPLKEAESARSSNDESDVETEQINLSDPCCSKNLPFDDDLVAASSSSVTLKPSSALFDVSRPSPTLSSPISSRMKQKYSRRNAASAYETRSKKSLCGIPIEQLEAPLFDIRPDFDFDLTPMHETDEDYVNFLSTAIAGNLCHCENKDEDDSNDPEYNFLEDQEIIDGDELRLDKATKVSKKELHGLLSDLLDIFNEEGPEANDETFVGEDIESNLPSTSRADASNIINRSKNRVEIKENNEIVVVLDKNNTDQSNERNPLHSCAVFVVGDESTDFSATLLSDVKSLPMFTEFEEEQLQEQMRKHVQLLTQTFLLSKCSNDLHKERSSSVTYLNEINHSFMTSRLGERSKFNVFNLPLALKIVDECWNLIPKEKFYNEIVNRRHRSSEKLTRTFPSEMREIIANSKCFLYPQLLPKCRPLEPEDVKEKKRLPPFFPSEDLLLALGYLQFHQNSNFLIVNQLIKDNCLPVRSVDTIKNRLHKLSNFIFPDNIVKDARLDKIYPNINRVTTPFDPLTVVEPRFLPVRQLPRCFAKFVYTKGPKSIDIDFKKRTYNHLNKPEKTNEMNGFLMNHDGHMFQVTYNAGKSLKFKMPNQNDDDDDAAESSVVVVPSTLEAVVHVEPIEPTFETLDEAKLNVDDATPGSPTRSPSPSPSIVYVNIGTPTSLCGDEPCVDDVDTNAKSPSPPNLTDSKNKHRTKRIRTPRVDNILKTILSYDEQSEENLNEAMAGVFLKSLRDGLFMHQSQLERFFDAIRRSPIDCDLTKTFEILMKILRERPTPHRNLSDLLTMFLRADQASTFGCYQLYRNQRTALNAFSKLERYAGTQKHKSSLKLLFRRLKNDDTDWTEEKLCEELRQIVGCESLVLWDHLKQLFDRETIGKRSYEDEGFEFIDQSTFDRGFDEFENVTLDVNFDNEFATGQRICACICHKNDVVAHCNSCKIKFYDGKIYIFKSGRWNVPAVLEPGGVVSFFVEPLVHSETSRNDVDCVAETPLADANLEDNENIRRFMNLIDAFENESCFTSPRAKRSRDEEHVPDDPYDGSKSSRRIDVVDDESSLSNSIFLRGSEGRHVMLERADELCSTENSVAETCQKYAAGSASDEQTSLQNEIHRALTSSPAFVDVWTENFDRCLLEELKTFGVLDDACRSAAKKLQLEHFLVKNRMQFLIEVLENDHG